MNVWMLGKVGREKDFPAWCQHSSLAFVCSAGAVAFRTAAPRNRSLQFVLCCATTHGSVATAVFSRCLRSQHMQMSPRRTRRGSSLLLCESTRFDTGSQIFTAQVLSLKIILRNVYNRRLPFLEGTNFSFVIFFLVFILFSFRPYFRCTFYKS
jgi:hypothetical protein